MKHFHMLVAMALACAGLSVASPLLAQKYGGTLQVLIAAAPDSLSIHEGSPVNTVGVSALFNNLVFYDPLVARESLDTIRPELAEGWSWNPEKTALTFKLRQGVTWHDGKPFSSADVKRTFDVVRGASQERPKLNPRKAWYANVESIATNGDGEVTFWLKRPQPSLIAMLAAGSAPVMAAHFPVADWRTKALGTGPFVLTEYQRDKLMLMNRNPRYFVAGRPYLDAVRMNIIHARATQVAAYVAGQLDVVTYSVALKPFMEAVKQGTDQVLFHKTVGTNARYVMFNPRKPPFDNPRLRLAMSAALDRVAYGKTVLQGGAVIAGTLTPPPIGYWGQTHAELVDVPGYGDPEKGKAEAQRIMRELGYGPDNPLKAEILANPVAVVLDSAVWTAGALKPIYVDATVKQSEPAVFRAALARRDFQIVAYSSTNGSDDPDITFYEHYGCGSLRSYNDYCNPDLQRKFDEQSQMFDTVARHKLVREIDVGILRDAPRAMMGFGVYYFPTWPYVKNFVPHQANSNFWRFQEVWLDK
ncbi:MAG: ABC transporter substrate-binding protein [Candidatus Lambdaproteobacteria bacterium]|nr:ABC transporter substrate-binding protein [Candidatus Lambdaproteobacteria bacterium]